MNWYYVEAGKQAGPVDEAQLDELARSGKIAPETLVWHEGMANWQAYSIARAPEPGQHPEPVLAAAAPPSEGAVCSECGKLFPVEETIRYGEVRVCASCKPRFVQKLAEGAHVGGGLNFAKVWTRFSAVFLDGLILGAVNIVIGMIAGLGIGQAVGAQPSGALALQLVLFAIQVTIGISYETILIGKYGATLGKKACKVKVVMADGGKVSYGRALGRYFAKLLSGFLCGFGYLMAFWDDEKRALHDRICNTRVVIVTPDA